MSDTPRTDAEECDGSDGGLVVSADFARQLERENAELRASLERCLNEAIGWLDECSGREPSGVTGYDGWDEKARRLLATPAEK